MADRRRHVRRLKRLFSHPAVGRDTSGASRRKANHALAFWNRSATERNRASPSKSCRPIAVRNRRTCVSVLAVAVIQPSAVLQRLVVRIQHSCIARPPARWHKRRRPQIFLQHESRHRLMHRHFDATAFACALTTEQRRQDRTGGDLPRHMIAQQQRRETRVPSRRSDNPATPETDWITVSYAGCRDRTARPEAADRAMDQTGS